MNSSNIFFTVISIIVASIVTMFLKNICEKYKRPNSKKRGIISLHIVIATSLILSTFLTTNDYYITGLLLLLTYLLTSSKISSGSNYTYQVGLSIFIGLGITYSIWYIWQNKLNGGSNFSSVERTDINTEKPHLDQRTEADSVPELSLEHNDEE